MRARPDPRECLATAALRENRDRSERSDPKARRDRKEFRANQYPRDHQDLKAQSDRLASADQTVNSDQPDPRVTKASPAIRENPASEAHEGFQDQQAPAAQRGRRLTALMDRASRTFWRRSGALSP